MDKYLYLTEKNKFDEKLPTIRSRGHSDYGKLIALNREGKVDNTMLELLSIGSPLLYVDKVLTILKADASTDGYLSSSDWNSFTTSIAGAVPITRTVTVNGDTQDLSADVSFTVSVPTITPSALTKVNDTNVTLTLGGTPTTALLESVSITAGWTGTLADGRIASASTWNNKVTSLTAGTGITIGGTTTVPTVTNSAPDQTVTLTAGTGIAVSGTYPSFTITNSAPSTTSGTVTSVALSVPTGLSISGSPITTSGTLALSLTSGYSIPSTTSQTNWDTAYTNRITSCSAPLSLSSNVLSITAATTSVDGYLSSTDWNTFNGKQASLGGSGIVKSTAGTISYLTDNSSNWDTAYTNRITSLAVTGTTGAATLASNILTIPTYANSWRTMTPSSSVAGRYYTTPCGSQAQAAVVNINTGVGMWGIPFPIGNTGVTASKIGMATDGGGSVGTKILLSIYNDDGTTTKPGTLLTQCGTINCDTLGLQTITISQALTANTMYWLVGHVQSGNNVKPSAAAKNTSLVNLGYPITNATATDYYTWVSSVQTYTGTAITPFPTSPTYNSGIMPMIFVQL